MAIAAGSSDQVWGTYKTGVYRRTPASSFAQVLGAPPCTWITASSDGMVWALDAPGKLFGWLQNSSKFIPFKCNVQLREIAVTSAGLLWGLDFQGNVHVSREPKSKPPL